MKMPSANSLVTPVLLWILGLFFVGIGATLGSLMVHVHPLYDASGKFVKLAKLTVYEDFKDHWRQYGCLGIGAALLFCGTALAAYQLYKINFRLDISK